MTIKSITRTEVELTREEDNTISETNRIIQHLLENIRDDYTNGTLYSDSLGFEYSVEFIDKVKEFLSDLIGACDLEIVETIE